MPTYDMKSQKTTYDVLSRKRDRTHNKFNMIANRDEKSLDYSFFSIFLILNCKGSILVCHDLPSWKYVFHKCLLFGRYCSYPTQVQVFRRRVNYV